MAIVQTIDTASEFEQAFKAYNREDNFSPKGLRELFEYLEEYSNATGEDYRLDVVALCCDYRECKSIEEFMQEHNPDFDHEEFKEAGDEGKLEMIRDYLENNTSVVCCESDCILFQVF